MRLRVVSDIKCLTESSRLQLWTGRVIRSATCLSSPIFQNLLPLLQ